MPITVNVTAERDFSAVAIVNNLFPSCVNRAVRISPIADPATTTIDETKSLADVPTKVDAEPVADVPTKVDAEPPVRWSQVNIYIC